MENPNPRQMRAFVRAVRTRMLPVLTSPNREVAGKESIRLSSVVAIPDEPKRWIVWENRVTKKDYVQTHECCRRPGRNV